MYDVTLNQIHTTHPRNNEWKTLVDTFTYSRLAHEYNLALNPIEVLKVLGFESFLRIFSNFTPYRKIFINFASWASLRNIGITKQHIPEKLYINMIEALMSNDIMTLNRNAIFNIYVKMRKTTRFSHICRALYAAATVGTDTVASLDASARASFDYELERTIQEQELFYILKEATNQ
ncbi:hypothetical protein [Vibrio diazotrophicus]|uniref:hypothetical protein n=1 Tax=Vibrio diazotrophicus TaxID=685 RepID=UPI00142DC113|nr:hypothetical protein [Vibrio diazotrophicus]NIY91089.1 hypothetical protein [Vibrio diazotrophicus]